MILYKIEITRDTVAKYFPETLSNEPNTHYGIEITAMRKTNSKLISHAHIGVFNWRAERFVKERILPADHPYIRVMHAFIYDEMPVYNKLSALPL